MGEHVLILMVSRDFAVYYNDIIGLDSRYAEYQEVVSKAIGLSYS